MKRRIAHRKPRLELLESRLLLSADVELDDVRSIDGTGNNLANPDWGGSAIELVRLSGVEYADGHSAPAGSELPSARAISNLVMSQEGSISNDRFLTDFVWLWGQFVDHDIDLTIQADPAESFDIPVPTGDSSFDPFGTGTVTLGLDRSEYSLDSNGVRQQINSITAYIDGSMIYGSDAERAAALRSFQDGQLRVGDGDLLPMNDLGFDNAGPPGGFLAGDVRANENVALTAMHTLWVREHNRLAQEISAQGPSLDDEQIYHRARAIVIAEIQAITYNEFLPALLGRDALEEYAGYDPTVNPSIANEFSTAAYRFGHSMVSPELLRLNSDGSVIDDGNLSLASAFFSPNEIINHGIEALLHGAATQTAQEIDTSIIDELRNFLFGPPGAGGLDLASLNMQRGRDHGLSDYNTLRTDVGLEPVSSFSEITSNPVVEAQLQQLYGSVDNIEAWVGILAEDHSEGSSIGELGLTIIADQFIRLRDGDRFWYQNMFSGAELNQIQDTTLADVIMRNTEIEGLRSNVFMSDEVFFYDVAESTQSEPMTLEYRRGDLLLTQNGGGQVLLSRPSAEVSAIMIVGSGHTDRLTVQIAGMNHLGLEGFEVHLEGGDHDSLRVVGTRAKDNILVSDIELIANDVLIVTSGTEDIRVDGGRGNDRLRTIGRPGSRIQFMGGPGDDLLRGGAGDDLLIGGGGNDRLVGRAGNDDMRGGVGDDEIWGGDGDDNINGGRDDDRLIGGADDDTLCGSIGTDRIQGGNGSDLALRPGPEDRLTAIESTRQRRLEREFLVDVVLGEITRMMFGENEHVREDDDNSSDELA